MKETYKVSECMIPFEIAAEDLIGFLLLNIGPGRHFHRSFTCFYRLFACCSLFTVARPPCIV